MAIKVERQSQYLKDVLEEERYVNEVQKYTDLLTGRYQAAQSQYQATAQQAAAQASYDISGAYANYLKQQRSVVAAEQLESGYKQELGGIAQTQYQSAYGQAKATEAQRLGSASDVYNKATSGAYSEYLSNIENVEKMATQEANYLTSIHSAADEYVKLHLNELSNNITQSAITKEDFPLYEVVNGVEQLTDYGKSVYTKALLEGEGFKQYLDEQGLSDEAAYYLSAPSNIHEKLFGITATSTLGENQSAITSGFLKTPGYIESVTIPTLDLSWRTNRSASEHISENVETLYNKYMPQLGLTELPSTIVTTAIDNFISSEAIKTGSQGLSQRKLNDAIKNITNELSGETLNIHQLSEYLTSLFKDSKITGEHVEKIFTQIVSELQKTSINKYRGE